MTKYQAVVLFIVVLSIGLGLLIELINWLFPVKTDRERK